MNSLNDMLQKRVDDFDMGRGDTLSSIQEVINKKYMGRVRAKKLQDGVLTLSTPSSVVASNLRMAQVSLKKQLNQYEIKDIRIQIG